MPDDRREQEEHQGRPPDPPHPQPGQVGDTDVDGHERDRRAQIGLPRDEQERHGDEHAADEEVGHRPAAPAAFPVEGCQHERQRQAGELRGLQADERQRDPAARSAAHRPEERHVQQQQHERGVDEERALGQRAVVDRHARRHDREADRQRVELRPEAGTRLVGLEVPRHAVNGRDADERQDEQRADQRPVDVGQQPPIDADHSRLRVPTAATVAGAGAGRPTGAAVEAAAAAAAGASAVP